MWLAVSNAARAAPETMLAAKNHNQNEVLAVLNCRRLPGRLNTTEASVLLGFQEHDITTLVAARLLTPLGKPAPNSPKFFASAQIAELSADTDWLGKATKAVAAHWQRKNFKTGKVATT